MKCVLLNCWGQISQDAVNTMDVLNVVSTRMYTMLALIVNFK